MEQNEFVISKLSVLDQELTGTEAELDQAWLRVHRSLTPRRLYMTPWRWLATAAAAIAITISFTPGIAAWAQAVWTRLAFRQVESISLDLHFTTANLLLPNVFTWYPPSQNQVWKLDSAIGASSVAGFDVKTLTSSLVPRASRLDVISAPMIRHVFRSEAAEADLRRMGRALPPVPAGLDGGEIILEPQGKSVLSFYGDCPELIGPGDACALLVQSRLPTLRLPSTVSYEEYVRFSLELAGVPRSDASRLALWSSNQPVLFVPLEAKSEIRRVHARGGDATLIVYPASVGGETAFALDWQEHGFSYRLFGRGPENAIALAESVR